MRLDRALSGDLKIALRSWPIRSYLLLQLAAGALLVARRGTVTASMVALIWMGLLALAFLAWWSGRHRLAHPQADAVANAGARGAFALLGAAGMTAWGFRFGGYLGLLLVLLGVAGWTWAGLRADRTVSVREQLTRDPRPLIPLLLLVGVPKLLMIGPAYVVGALLALPSGVGQQLLYLIGLFAPLEAWTRRPALAAVVAALVFALVHVPLLLDPNDGDLMAATANAVIFQSGVGLVAVVAYRRHRAAVPIGVAHALAIG